MLGREGLLASPAPTPVHVANPLAPRGPHFDAPAKNVIFLFMSGGPSHVDLFDYKPDLIRLAGKPIPESFGKFKTRRKVAGNNLLGPLREFRPRGQSGTQVSEWLPNIAECMDDICLLRGCHGDSVTHPESVYLMNTGSILMGRPSLGSWAAYGLGSENQNMPAFVVMPDSKGWVKGGAPAGGNGYLPATYQGTILRGGDAPILNLNTPEGISDRQQRDTVSLINQLNRQNLPPGGGRILLWRPAFPRTNSRSACNPTRMKSSLLPAKARRRASCMVWTIPPPRTSARAVCWPDEWWNAESGLFNSTAATRTVGTDIRRWIPTILSSVLKVICPLPVY